MARIGVTPSSHAEPVPAAVAPPPTTLTERPASFRVEVTGLEASIGAGAGAPGLPTAVAPWLSAEASVLFNKRLALGVLGLFDFGGSAPVFDEDAHLRGTYTTRGGMVLPSLAYCAPTTLRLCAGALVGAHIVQGEVSGAAVFQTRVARAAGVTVGPTLNLSWSPGLVRLTAHAALLLRPQPPALEIEGLATIRQPVVQGAVWVSVGIETPR